MNNAYLTGNAGRNPMFATPEDLNTKAGEYFEHCQRRKLKPTITGAALFLGFASRQSLYEYEARPGFTYYVQRIRLAIENAYESAGQTIDIFALKNLGWSDKQSIDITTDLSQLSEAQLIIIGNEIAKKHIENDKG